MVAGYKNDNAIKTFALKILQHDFDRRLIAIVLRATNNKPGCKCAERLLLPGRVTSTKVGAVCFLHALHQKQPFQQCHLAVRCTNLQELGAHLLARCAPVGDVLAHCTRHKCGHKDYMQQPALCCNYQWHYSHGSLARTSFDVAVEIRAGAKSILKFTHFYAACRTCASLATLKCAQT